MNKFVVGVDIGGTNIKLGLVSPGGKVIARNSISTKLFISSQKKLINEIANQINILIKQHGISKNKLAGIGIGLPGLIDSKKGVVCFLPNIPGWKNVKLKSILENELGVPVYIDNDVKLITLAEWKLGAGKGQQNLICITLGTGLGSGLVLDNKLFRGEGNAAGELGHMPVHERGFKCNCGGINCYETLVGNKHLIDLANTLMKKTNLSLPDMHDLAMRGNKQALRFWKEVSSRIALGLIGVVNLLNPSTIVIGGGVSNNERFLFPDIKKILNERAMSIQSKMVHIKRAAFGDDAGIIGAYVLVNNVKKI